MSDIFLIFLRRRWIFLWRCCCVCRRFMRLYSLHFAYYESYQSPSWSSSTFCYNIASLELLLLIKFRTGKDIIEFYFEWINYHEKLHSLNEFSILITIYVFLKYFEGNLIENPMHNSSAASTLKYSMKTLFCRLICIHRL